MEKKHNLSMRLVKPRLAESVAHGKTAYEQLIESFLEKIQQQLTVDQAKMVVAINTETGEYVLGEDSRDAAAAFRRRWPTSGYYMCCADGSPSGRM